MQQEVSVMKEREDVNACWSWLSRMIEGTEQSENMLF
jgi:hypothetical protein